MNELRTFLADYNSIIKECDKLYHDVARLSGLSDSTFWILYTLRETKEEMTQSDIVSVNYFPPQTINSALKKMEVEGFIQFRHSENKKRKPIILTPKGEELAKKTVDRVIFQEADAAKALSIEERKVFLKLFNKYTERLKENFSVINKENQADE